MKEVTKNEPATLAGAPATPLDPIAPVTSGSVPAAFAAGLAASLVGAGLWAVITISAHMQIGFMAVGVGFLVAWAVRRFGQGTQPVYGVIGAALALFGCVGGNLLSACGFLAAAQGKPFSEVLNGVLADPALGVRLLQATFNGMDVVFYAIAVYEGYTLARRPARG